MRKVSKQTRSESPAPQPATVDEIRNVVLVGPSGAGKTALSEAALAAAVPGHRAPGKEHTRSVTVNAVTFSFANRVINLLDTPGYPDFVGDLRAGLRGADAAIFVLSGADGIDRAMQLLWHECAALSVPRAVVDTHLDQPRADYDAVFANARATFGDAQPIAIPVLADGILTSVVNLLRTEDSDSPHRNELLEAVIEESEDDTLLDRYLSGESLDPDALAADLKVAIAKGNFFPVLLVDPMTGVGIPEVLQLIAEAFPSPAQAWLPAAYTPAGGKLPALVADPSAPLVAEVIRTTSDPYVGRLSLVRVFQGTLRSDLPVHVSGHLESFASHDVSTHPSHDSDERIAPLAAPVADGTAPKDHAIAGELVLVAKLAHAETSDTISSPEHPTVVEPWLLPEPLLPVAIRAVRTADEDKLASALARLVTEDMTVRLEHNPETHQAVLWTLGQAHVEELTNRLRDRFGVDVETESYRTALRETFLRPASAQGRHVKQSGGHGQYAVCHLSIEPLPRGSGIEFVDKVVGGAVPRNFIPSVEKGARAQLEKGLLAGYPVVDVRVTLFDGKAHSVDSSDVAFQVAAATALKEAANAATVGLLEPIDAVRITTGEDFLGSVMADLSSRRGHVLGTEPAEDPGWVVVLAEVPQSELSRYPIDLRSVSHGTGRFTRELARYDYLPADVAKRLIEA